MGGWHENTFVAGETKDAKKTIPFALITGVLIITLFYVAINYIYIYLIPVREISNAKLIASDVLQILLGTSGRKLLEALIIISALGCLNAMIITGSRVTYAMAKDNIIFRYIGQANVRYGTPERAIAISVIWSMVLIVIGTFNELLIFTGILVWLFFALVVGGIFILRYRMRFSSCYPMPEADPPLADKFPDTERPYRVWGYPLIPALFIIICILLCINTTIFYPKQSLIGLGLAMTGVPIFFISRGMGKYKHGSHE